MIIFFLIIFSVSNPIGETVAKFNTSQECESARVIHEEMANKFGPYKRREFRCMARLS